MSLSFRPLRRLADGSRPRFPVAGVLVSVTLFSAGISSRGQVIEPQPAPTSTPVVDPVSSPLPNPTATPTVMPTASPISTPTDSPSLVVTPGVPSAGEMEVYNSARTPQVEITLRTATVAPVVSAANSASASSTASVLRPVVQDGVRAAIVLRAVASPRGKTPRNSSATGENPQPTATVILTYPPGSAGQLVWVQMSRRDGGTLNATDSEGRIYSGEHGFDLTLDANGQATFNYQAPNVSSTYQILTRFGNVVTVLSFVVPDAAP